MGLIYSEDIRIVPIVTCAFADDTLKTMFQKFLRDGIPGGKKALLGRFGPISSLYARIQFAHAFAMISEYILVALDKIREQRNKISHTWNSDQLQKFYTEMLPMPDLEEALADKLILAHPSTTKLSRGGPANSMHLAPGPPAL